jgi:hypothetical protein
VVNDKEEGVATALAEMGRPKKRKREGEKGKEVSGPAGSPVGWRGCLGQRAELEREREE